MFMVGETASDASSGYSFDSLDDAHTFATESDMSVYFWTGQVKQNPIDGFMDPIYEKVEI